jgi:hypothetical protein
MSTLNLFLKEPRNDTYRVANLFKASNMGVLHSRVCQYRFMDMLRKRAYANQREPGRCLAGCRTAMCGLIVINKHKERQSRPLLLNPWAGMPH